MNGLTAQDIEDLEFVVNMPIWSDFHSSGIPPASNLLQKHLKRLKAGNLGIVMKIETRAAFDNFPELLFSLMHTPTIGVMIARGDLAVECGYERLAELQEEILWLAGRPVCRSSGPPRYWRDYPRAASTRVTRYQLEMLERCEFLFRRDQLG